ncbi:hypothetical protein O181_103863 [Austropuccinia psidii MF-1]|uniref:Uncharacterized protein n=1 Tax=Austropuccinia psidii MF-1 TaxID=1389203 RepID=A0A9Q3JL46_9BASI|nr:hypothetical protein [Austropuccinia psidii MF-1]
MPSTRSGASYNPSSSSQKGHRHDYGRSQSVREVQGADTPTRRLSDIFKSRQKAYNNGLKHKEYQILSDLWKNCMNPYLTVRKLLGNTNTCKLLNGWHPLMEKKNMILLTEEWKKNNPQPPKKVPKTAPVASSSNYNVKSTHKLRIRAKARHQTQNPTARAKESQRFSRMRWKMYFSWPEQ